MKQSHKNTDKHHNMVVGVSPNISAFITETRRLEKSRQIIRLEQEKMKIASKEYISHDNTHFGIWRLLFVQLRNIAVNELEFIKAYASKDINIKCAGYLGLIFMDNPKHGVMLVNTLSKDLEDDKHIPLVLRFISNFNDSEKFVDLCSRIKNITENSGNYNAYIVANSKLKKTLDFAVFSRKDSVLFPKLQILLDENYFDQLNNNDLSYLRERIYVTNCRYTLLKLIQCYRSLCMNGLYSINEKLYEFIKDLLANPNSKTMKQIDLALSIESCKLLIETGHFSERAECFIFRMVNSENPNSRHIAFAFAKKYAVLSDLIIDRIIKLGLHLFSHLGRLLQLIDKTNYKRVYKQREEIVHYMLKNKASSLIAERISKCILTRIAELSDFEFLCKLLVENPKIYQEIRSKNLIAAEHARPLFKAILHKEDINFFPMIYDTMPSKILDDNYILSLASRHISILMNHYPNEQILGLFDNLFDILIIHEIKNKNRNLIVEVYCKAISQKAPSILIDKLLSGIMLFNLVLSTKLIEIEQGTFIEYQIVDGVVTVSYSKELGDLNAYRDNYTDINCKKTQDENMSKIILPIYDKNKINEDKLIQTENTVVLVLNTENKLIKKILSLN